MKSAIEEIMFGEGSHSTFALNDYAKKLLSELTENGNALEKALDEKASAFFERYRENEQRFQLEQGILYYKEGFRFGFRLAMEVFLCECTENRKN